MKSFKTVHLNFRGFFDHVCHNIHPNNFPLVSKWAVPSSHPFPSPVESKAGKIIQFPTATYLSRSSTFWNSVLWIYIFLGLFGCLNGVHIVFINGQTWMKIPYVCRHTFRITVLLFREIKWYAATTNPPNIFFF